MTFTIHQSRERSASVHPQQQLDAVCPHISSGFGETGEVFFHRYMLREIPSLMPFFSARKLLRCRQSVQARSHVPAMHSPFFQGQCYFSRPVLCSLNLLHKLSDIRPRVSQKHTSAHKPRIANILLAFRVMTFVNGICAGFTRHGM